MPQFKYTAKQGPHKIVDGMIEAPTQDEAVANLSRLGYIPLEVRSLAEKKKPMAFSWDKLVFQRSGRVTDADRVLFTRQASDLVDAGVPILQMLRLIIRQTQNAYFLGILEQVFDAVKDGGSLSSAMDQHPQAFPKLFVNMARAGELSGQLPIVLSRLADFIEREQETQAQVKTSLIYPGIILVVASLTIFGLFTFVIPRITGIFEDLNQELPWPTQVIMAISYFFQNFWWVLIGAITVLIFYLDRLGKTERGKAWMDQLMLRVPVFGSFIRTAEISRFARCLGTLLGSGVVIVSALEAVWLLMDNAVIKAGVKQLAQEVSNGSGLTAAMKANPLFPEAVVSMVAVGEESGQMERGLYKLADYYERQTQRFVKRMTSLVEPILILFLGLVVGFIFVGMLLPILQMNLVVK